MSGEVKEKPVIWLQAASDSGCSVSMLNSVRPEIHTVLLDQIVPGQHINLRFQATIMAGQGEPAVKILDSAASEDGGFLLVVEGSIPLNEKCCTLGQREGEEVSMAQRVKELAEKADAVIALGTCASFGGLFAAHPNYPECVGIGEFFDKEGIDTPYLTVPGCPPHPDWFIGTVAQVVLYGLPGTDEIDDLHRLKLFYGTLIHENCPRRPHFDAGRFSKKLSEPYCLYLLGCRGPQTHADCPTRHWNNGVNWCIENNHPCIGCCEPEFPDGTSPFFRNIPGVCAPALRIDESGDLKPENRSSAFLG